MVEILDADPRILSKVRHLFFLCALRDTFLLPLSLTSQYLEQARNDPTAAIGQFLMDQSQGRLLRA